MKYDDSLSRLHEIVTYLESDQAISLDEYRRLADEAKQLLADCRNQLTSIEDEITSVFNEPEK